MKIDHGLVFPPLVRGVIDRSRQPDVLRPVPPVRPSTYTTYPLMRSITNVAHFLLYTALPTPPPSDSSPSPTSSLTLVTKGHSVSCRSLIGMDWYWSMHHFQFHAFVCGHGRATTSRLSVRDFSPIAYFSGFLWSTGPAGVYACICTTTGQERWACTALRDAKPGA